ncbi:MAG: hypothetical protein KBG15_13455 [Kofleriaceae bacterium]|nr:hypothetical protein [Kofleriaceae bacterium]
MSSTSSATSAPVGASPGIRLVGHAAALSGGVLELLAGAGSLKRGLPPELTVMLLLAGTLTLLLTHASFQKRNRAAWSFLTVISGVMALCTLFGSAKIRGILGLGFGSVLAFPFLFAFAAGLLSTLGADYKEFNRTEASDDKQRRTA